MPKSGPKSSSKRSRKNPTTAVWSDCVRKRSAGCLLDTKKEAERMARQRATLHGSPQRIMRHRSSKKYIVMGPSRPEDLVSTKRLYEYVRTVQVPGVNPKKRPKRNPTTNVRPGKVAALARI